MQFEEQTTKSLVGVLGGDMLEEQAASTGYGDRMKAAIQNQLGRYSGISAFPNHDSTT